MSNKKFVRVMVKLDTVMHQIDLEVPCCVIDTPTAWEWKKELELRDVFDKLKIEILKLGGSLKELRQIHFCGELQ